MTSNLLKTNGKVALPLQTEASQSHSIPEICASLGIWYCHWTWRRIRSTSANTLQAGIFVIGQSGQDTSSWSEGPSDFFCWHFHRPLQDMTLLPHLA
jgi:hypothetical protein